MLHRAFGALEVLLVDTGLRVSLLSNQRRALSPGAVSNPVSFVCDSLAQSLTVSPKHGLGLSVNNISARFTSCHGIADVGEVFRSSIDCVLCDHLSQTRCGKVLPDFS